MRLALLALMLVVFCSSTKADDLITSIPPQTPLLLVQLMEESPEVEVQDTAIEKTAYIIMETYGVSLVVAYEISKYASILSSKYVGFPHVKDIIAIAWIESSMNPKARSKWAEGLMGINYKANKLEDSKSKRHSIPHNMSHGVNILREYYLQLKSRELALMAYNLGITSVKRGSRNYTYLRKYKRELHNLGNIK